MAVKCRESALSGRAIQADDACLQPTYCLPQAAKMTVSAIVKLRPRSQCSFHHFRNGIDRKGIIFIAMIIGNTIGNWKAAT
jgi:hypothetical protein